MVTAIKKEIIKKDAKWGDIRKQARLLWKTLITDKHYTYKTIEGERLREAVHQAMELADGEKAWVQNEKKNFNAWRKNRISYYKIPLQLNKTVGGFVGKRGEPLFYGVGASWCENDGTDYYYSTNMSSARHAIGD
jgi:hypothetical protein